MNSFFKKYIEFHEIWFKDSLVKILDHEFKVVFVGSELLVATGMTLEQTLGKHLYESAQIPEKNKILSNIILSEAIELKQAKHIFIANLNNHYRGYHVLLLTFEPIVEPESQHVIGAKLVFTPAEISYFFDVLIKVNEKIESNNLPDNDHYLTRREHQVAFLLCHDQDSCKIAKVLSLFNNKSILPTTVNNIICRYLFPKFDVNNKGLLIGRLKEQGYDKKIPNSLLSNQFIDLTKHKF